MDIQEINELVKSKSAFISALRTEMQKKIVGQKHMVDSLLIGLLGKGHILLEGVPGLAKTLAINTLSKAVQGSFSRIQFTPDLLPADVVGTVIYNMSKQEFSTKKGPVFANFVLADEINRAHAKVQSALLEAMQEKQVTIGEQTFLLEQPFLVMATQNPVEQEGTYPLPEAQSDRFMLKVVIDYPNQDDELVIMRQNMAKTSEEISSIIDLKQIKEAQDIIDQVYIDEKIENYILDLIFATRYPAKYKLSKKVYRKFINNKGEEDEKVEEVPLEEFIQYGASPRGSINLAKASKCYAFINGRGFVVPEDVRAVIYDVLRHRIGLSYLAEADEISSEQIIEQIVNTIEVP